jgi:hypothetical protein
MQVQVIEKVTPKYTQLLVGKKGHVDIKKLATKTPRGQNKND